MCLLSHVGLCLVVLLGWYNSLVPHVCFDTICENNVICEDGVIAHKITCVCANNDILANNVMHDAIFARIALFAPIALFLQEKRYLVRNKKPFVVHANDGHHTHK